MGTACPLAAGHCAGPHLASNTPHAPLAHRLPILVLELLRPLLRQHVLGGHAGRGAAESAAFPPAAAAALAAAGGLRGSRHPGGLRRPGRRRKRSELELEGRRDEEARSGGEQAAGITGVGDEVAG